MKKKSFTSRYLQPASSDGPNRQIKTTEVIDLSGKSRGARGRLQDNVDPQGRKKRTLIRLSEKSPNQLCTELMVEDSKLVSDGLFKSACKTKRLILSTEVYLFAAKPENRSPDKTHTQRRVYINPCRTAYREDFHHCFAGLVHIPSMTTFVQPTRELFWMI